MAASKCLQGEREDRLKICPAGHGGIVTGNSHILKQQTGFKEKNFSSTEQIAQREHAASSLGEVKSGKSSEKLDFTLLGAAGSGTNLQKSPPYQVTV